VKYQKAVTALSLFILALSIAASLGGLLTKGGPGQSTYTSVGGELVTLYGEGLYQNDSVSVAAQGRASDLVTLIFAAPLLLMSLIGARKGSFRSRLLLTGMLGYFLYTYMSYTFLWMYNRFFLLYVLLMSASFFAFVLSLMSFDLTNIRGNFKESLPVKYLAGFQFFVAAAVGLLWLGKITPTLTGGRIPVGLEHYTTLVIQGMDLGFVVPAAVLSGALLLKKNPFGYLFSCVIIVKGIAMLTAITAMMVNMWLMGAEVGTAEIFVFSALDMLALFIMAVLLKNTKEDNARASI